MDEWQIRDRAGDTKDFSDVLNLVRIVVKLLTEPMVLYIKSDWQAISCNCRLKWYLRKSTKYETPESGSPDHSTFHLLRTRTLGFRPSFKVASVGNRLAHPTSRFDNHLPLTADNLSAESSTRDRPTPQTGPPD